MCQVSVLVRGGYEAVVVAVLPEDDQLVQAASSAGTRYLNLHPTFLEGLLPFCKRKSRTWCKTFIIPYFISKVTIVLHQPLDVICIRNFCMF